MSPEDALSMSRRAQVRHMRTTITVTFARVSIANTTFFLLFFMLDLIYQSSTMPRYCVVAFLILTVDWVIQAVKKHQMAKKY